MRTFAYMPAVGHRHSKAPPPTGSRTSTQPAQQKSGRTYPAKYLPPTSYCHRVILKNKAGYPSTKAHPPPHPIYPLPRHSVGNIYHRRDFFIQEYSVDAYVPAFAHRYSKALPPTSSPANTQPAQQKSIRAHSAKYLPRTPYCHRVILKNKAGRPSTKVRPPSSHHIPAAAPLSR